MAKQVYIQEDMEYEVRLSNLNIKIEYLAKVFPDKNWRVGEHSHDSFEFHIIPQGRGYINIEGHDIEVNAGEFYVTGPYIRHTQRTDSENPMMEYCIKCQISLLEDEQGGIESFDEEGRVLRRSLSNCYPNVFKDINGAAAKFETIVEEMENKKLGYKLRVQAQVVNIVVDLLRVVTGADHQSGKRCEHVERERWIRRVNEFILQRHQEDIAADDFARVVFLSPRHVNRMMKKYSGRTFNEYLTDYRIEKATRLLQETGLKIEDIAAEAGFSSHIYLYQVFKKHGLPTPAKLRAAGDSQHT